MGETLALATVVLLAVKFVIDAVRLIVELVDR